MNFLFATTNIGQLRSVLELIMTSHQDLTLPVEFYRKVTVYDIPCVEEDISNVLNLSREGLQCAGARKRALRALP